MENNNERFYKILELRAKQGWEGYGLFCAIDEELKHYKKISVEDYCIIAFRYGVSVSKIRSIIEDYNLFEFSKCKKYIEYKKTSPEEKKDSYTKEDKSSFGKKQFRKLLSEQGASDKDIDDWFKHKKIFTERSYNNLVKECKDNSFPIKEAVKICADRGWQGFKYEWVKKTPQLLVLDKNR